jgi:hypothetical protein
MIWLHRILVGIDHLGNTIAGGNPHTSISARTGYFARVKKTPFRPWWKLMEQIIDYTFYPVDGPDHCYKSYVADTYEVHHEGSDLARGLLGILIILCCIPLALLVRINVRVFRHPRP